MSTSKIEWTEKTWNPTTGCNKVSAGCKNCYAEVMHKRLSSMHNKKYGRPFLNGARPYVQDLTLPSTWKKPCMVFVNSMSDLFHEDISFEYIDAVFSVMSDIDHHTYQVLTKRPERMVAFFEYKKNQFGIPWQPKDNVWLGVSVEDQQTADERIPLLLQVSAAVRFLSCEPLLGAINFSLVWRLLPDNSTEKIHWVIAGGESGHQARPMHPDWVRSLRDQCKAAGVPFFFKQWGEWRPAIFPAEGVGHKKKVFLTIEGKSRLTSSLITDKEVIMMGIGKNKSGRLLDGKEYNEYPKTNEVEHV